MTPERWQQIKEVFQTAREGARAEREAYLDAACANDAELRAQVVRLLAADEQPGDFLQAPALAPIRSESAAAAAIVGQSLSHYRVERQIGRGGMGVVYLARDEQLGRRVALKLLPERFLLDPERLSRFRREARAASALNHPNILTIYEIGEADGAPFIAAEFVEGRTLRALLESGELTLGQALDLAAQTAHALAAAHAAGIIHRDIKPENLMLRPDGYVKVLDFGLAKLNERVPTTAGHLAGVPTVETKSGVVMGTVSHMSPEQARGLEVDARSDLFSLGVVLYEMCAGCQPFTGLTSSDVLAAVLFAEPPPLDTFVPQIPAALQTIVSRALAKDCEQRYQSATALHDELKHLKQELELQTRLQAQSGNLLELSLGRAAQRQAEQLSTQKTGVQAARSTSRLRLLFDRFKQRPARATLWAAVLLTVALGLWLVFNRTGKFQLRVPGSQTSIDSLAVLPFANALNDPQMEYLPDGLTESLIGSLSQLPALTVMARSTVFTYKGREVDPRAVGAALKVRAVVMGRVARAAGEQMTISVELVDTASGARLWGREYQHAPSGVLLVKDELTRELGEVLRPHLSRAEHRQFAKPATSDNEAWQLYLRGHHLTNQGNIEGAQRALEYFNQAVTLDPRFALAHAGISDVYSTLSAQLLPPGEAMPKARQAALTALQLDETLPEAHNAMATVRWWADWDAAGAEREYKRALELNPNLSRTHFTYTGLLSQLGRFEEALAEIRRAEALDPLSLRPGDMLGGIFFNARQYEQAIAQYRKTLELYPNDATLHQMLGLALSQQGRHLEAVAEARQAVALNTALTHRAWLAYCLARAGQRAEALALLRDLQQRAAYERVSPVYFARIYVGLGEKELALQWLRKTYDEHSDHILNLKTAPAYDPLRADPRFQEMLRGIGLAQ